MGDKAKMAWVMASVGDVMGNRGNVIPDKLKNVKYRVVRQRWYHVLFDRFRERFLNRRLIGEVVIEIRYPLMADIDGNVDIASPKAAICKPEICFGRGEVLNSGKSVSFSTENWGIDGGVE